MDICVYDTIKEQKAFTFNYLTLKQFKDNSLYFRNALVRANYSNISKGIEEDKKYLILFFENLLLNRHNKLDNSVLKLSNKC